MSEMSSRMKGPMFRVLAQSQQFVCSLPEALRGDSTIPNKTDSMVMAAQKHLRSHIRHRE